MDLDEVHSLLDRVEDEIRRLAAETRREIDVLEDAGELCLVIGELVGWDSAYNADASERFGLPPQLLTKFIRMRGRVKTQEARIVADRIRNYLRSLDQRTPKPRLVQPPVEGTRKAPPYGFPAQRWTTVPETSDVKSRIATLAALLDNIVEIATKSNNPPEEQILTAIERQQLIAILETALAMLKTPMAEKGMLVKAREGLQRAAASAAEKEVQKGLGRLAEAAGQKIADLLSILF